MGATFVFQQTAMKFTDKLKELHACWEAVKWVGRRGIKTAWRDCKRGDWMLWLAGKLDIDRKLLVLAACDCAEQSLIYVPKGEDRPAKAIQVARNWCNGTASIDDVRAAKRNAAAYAAYAADAADAADAAAAAVYADAAAAYASETSLNTSADLVRKRIPVEMIEALL